MTKLKMHCKLLKFIKPKMITFHKNWLKHKLNYRVKK